MINEWWECPCGHRISIEQMDQLKGNYQCSNCNAFLSDYHYKKLEKKNE